MRGLSKKELRRLAIYYKLKALYTNGVVFMPSKTKLAKLIGIHYETLDRTLKYIIDNNLGYIDNSTSIRKLIFRNQLVISEYNKYKPWLTHKFRRDTILNASVEEVEILLSNILLKINTAQQVHKRNEAGDLTFIADGTKVRSNAQAKKRNRLLNKSLRGATQSESLLTLVSDRTIGNYLGISTKTANKMKHKIHNNGYAFFATMEKRIQEMSKLEFNTRQKYDEIPSNYFWKNGYLMKNIGTAYYPMEKQIENGFIQRFEVKELMNVLIGKREELGFSKSLISGMIESITTPINQPVVCYKDKSKKRNR